MSAMTKRPTHDYKQLALSLKKKFRNASDQANASRATAAKTLSGLGGTALAAFAAAKLSKAARDSGKPDPTVIQQLGNFPVMGLVGAGVALGSLALKNTRKMPNLKGSVASAGTHIAAGALYKYIADYAG